MTAKNDALRASARCTFVRKNASELGFYRPGFNPYLAATFFEKVAAARPSEKSGSLENGLGKMKSRVEKMR